MDWGWFVHGGPEKVTMQDGHECSWFHVPPVLLPEANRSSFYDGHDVFCITRHPYLRAVSEYMWELSLDPAVSESAHNMLNGNPRCTPEGLNYFLLASFKEYLDGGIFLHDCHMLPQSEFIWDDTGRQWCKDILRIEDLPGAFDELMLSKGLGARLNETVNRNVGTCPGLGVEDLSADTLAMLDIIYAEDFRRLNYTRTLYGLEPRRQALKAVHGGARLPGWS